jgi:formamidopyrimidine-DNA glycosylase
MPELPEVETVVHAIRPQVLGAYIDEVKTSQYRLRQPYPLNFTAQLAGKSIVSVTRRAKYILFTLNTGQILVVHLGMSGVLRCGKEPWQAKHSHAFFYLNNQRCLTYYDPRRFGLLTLLDKRDYNTHPLFARLGIEPLINEFDGKYLHALCNNKRQPIKVLLMDAALIVGVGNIYASESLFMAAIHPQRPAATLSLEECIVLVKAIKQVLLDAINSGGSTLRDYTMPDGQSGYFQHKFMVYGRNGQPCYQCGGILQKTVMAGRSTFYCQHCQK